MLFRNFGQAHSRTAACYDLLSVNVEWCTTDSTSFQFRATHSGSNALDD